MNQEFPKPLRNALARQAGGEDHPSPDVLTSFMERTLPRDESDIVTHHLSQCADCRDVVFLASSAAEDVAVDKVVLAAAPRRRWRLGLSWAVAAVAALLVSGVLVWNRLGPADLAHPTASNVASNAQPGSAQPAAPPTPAAPETLEYSARAEISPPKTSSALATKGVTPKREEKHPSAPMTPPPPELAKAQPSAALGGQDELAPPAAVPKNAFIQNPADTAPSPYVVAPPVNPMMALLGVRAASGQWRVSSDGQLEHRAADEWARVLADQATIFRVVSVVGSDVWAGGSGGALFHSDDGGDSWNRVALATSSGGAETGTIVSIQFSDPQHGTVITGAGAHWSTSDGGATWARQ